MSLHRLHGLAILISLGVGTFALAQDAPKLLPAPALPAGQRQPVAAEAEARGTDEPADAAAQVDAGDETAGLLEALRASHPWAAWEPGAWRRVRIVSEALGAKDEVVGRSVTVRTERLVARDESTYEIEVESVTELSGRPTPTPVERRKLWLANDRPVSLGEPVFFAEPASSISLGGVMTPCRVLRVEQPTAAGLEAELLYLSDRGTPVLLRRELNTASESAGAGSLIASAVAAGTPVLHGDALLEGWRRVTRVTRPAGGRSQAISLHSPAVPGGLHHESLAEYDPEGRRVRWSVTDLLASGSSASEEGRAGLTETEGEPPALSIEVRPRRFLRLLRRQGEETEQEDPLQ